MFVYLYNVYLKYGHARPQSWCYDFIPEMSEVHQRKTGRSHETGEGWVYSTRYVIKLQANDRTYCVSYYAFTYVCECKV